VLVLVEEEDSCGCCWAWEPKVRLGNLALPAQEAAVGAEGGEQNGSVAPHMCRACKGVKILSGSTDDAGALAPPTLPAAAAAVEDEREVAGHCSSFR
jgi:hypothetical protein